MFFFSRHKTPLVRGSTPGEKFLRLMLLFCVFAGVGWLFWHNSSKTMDDIQSRGAIYDATGQLDTDTKKTLREFTSAFRDEFGITLKIRVSNEPREELNREEMDRKTLLLAVFPERRQAVILAPAYLALDPGLIDYLETDVFAFYFEQEAWPQGIVQALAQILAALEGEEATP